MLLHAQRVLGLHDLGRRVHDVRHVHAQRTAAVARGARALAAAVRLVEDRPAAVGGARAEDQHARGRRAAGRHAVGQGGGERLEDGVDGALRGLVVAAHHGSVGVGVQEIAGRHDHAERPVAAVVGRHLRRGDRLDRVVHGGARDVVRGVDRAARLRRRPREVERRLVAADLHAHPDRQRSVVDAVVVEPVLAGPHAVGQRAEGRAHRGFGGRVQRLEAGRQRVRAVALDQLAEPARRHVVGRELREQIAPALVAAAQIREDEVDLLLVRPVGREQADRRDAHALLIRLGGPRHVGAGDGAADVRPVRQVDGEGHEAPAGEDRPDGLHVGQMVAAHLGQVEEPDVAIAQAPGRDALEKLLHGERHHAHVDRDVAPLGDQPPFGVGQRGGQVARLFQQRRARRAHEHDAHLLRDRVERVADDLERDGMDGGAHAPASMTRLPSRSAAQRWPG